MSVIFKCVLINILVFICGILSKKEHHMEIFDHLLSYKTSKHVFYWLYTRDTPQGQMLNRSEPHMIESTTYNASYPTKVVVHGWLGTTQEKEGFCMCTYKAYLKVGDYNVICVDWRQYSTDLTYAGAKLRAKYIAKDIANVLKKITYNMTVGVQDLHLVGHSMGAHITGFVGKILIDPMVPRITGLDPARPLYENNDPEDRLDINDAYYVDVIHTNGGKNGILRSMGNIDFFPNGGKSQPNCPKVQDKTTGSCSHIKSYLYFAHSIWAKQDYVSCKCSSWKEYSSGACDCIYKTYMGEKVDQWQTGNYYLSTDVEDQCSN